MGTPEFLLKYIFQHNHITAFLTIQQFKMNWTTCAMTISLCIWSATCTHCNSTYDCPETEACGPISHHCLEGCDKIHENCEAPQKCNYRYLWCNECQVDGDCGSDYFCDEYGFCTLIGKDPMYHFH